VIKFYNYYISFPIDPSIFGKYFRKMTIHLLKSIISTLMLSLSFIDNLEEALIF
jgi:hypothetical protein